MYEDLARVLFPGDDIGGYLRMYPRLFQGELFQGKIGSDVHRLYALVEKVCSSYVYLHKVNGEALVSVIVLGDVVARASGGRQFSALFAVTEKKGGGFDVQLVVPPGGNVDPRDLDIDLGLCTQLFEEGEGNRRVMVIREKYLEQVTRFLSTLAKPVPPGV